MLLGRSARIRSSVLAIVLLVLTARSSTADSIPIVDLDPNSVGSPYYGFDENHVDGMVGWQFDLLEPVTVTQVGWFDDGQDGLSRDFQVGLWRESDYSQLLGSPSSGIVIPAGTSTTLNGVWRVVDLPVPLDLQPGGYDLAGPDTQTTSDVIRFINVGDHHDDPAITGSRLDIGGPVADSGSGFHRPQGYALVYGVEFGPILFIAVPEPSSFALLGTGMLLLLGGRKLGS
jgi:PEP-CTERM motif